MRHITSFDPLELSQIISDLGQPSYRTAQIYQWIYQKGACSFDQMLNLPKTLREALKKLIVFSFPKILKIQSSSDGTQKFLIEFGDDSLVESVVIEEDKRLTLCISSQIGCRWGCIFCLTGKMGLRRSLKHYEISDQLLIISNFLRPLKLSNIVIMGMGEPLDNYSEVIKAIKTITDNRRGGFSPRRITVSTVGIIPGIAKLAGENLGIKLAVSINAPTERIRSALMPVNRKYPLSSLIKCIGRFPLNSRERITLEYCLIRGINDSTYCATALVSLLKDTRRRIKVNLIPYNPNPLLPFCTPNEKSIQRFIGKLIDAGILATVRRSKGGDILAACGQLGCVKELIPVFNSCHNANRDKK